MDDQWLRMQFRLNPDRTKADLAKALGLGAPAVSKILAGGRRIRADEYAIMRRFFGLPVDGEKAAGVRKDAYVISPLQVGDRSVRNDPGEWVMPADLIRARTDAPPEKIRIFSVKENSMSPDFMPGEQVLVDLSDTGPSPSGVFVISDGMGHIIRQCEYVPRSSPPAVRLTARNPRFDPRVMPLKQAGLMGRVIAKLEWL